MSLPLQATAAEHAVVLELLDRDRNFDAVRLLPEVGDGHPPYVFDRGAGAWRVEFAQPATDRLEYRVALTRDDGRRELALDPGNSRRVETPLGPRSVLEFDGYTRPAWLDTLPPRGSVAPFAAETRVGTVEGQLWRPPGIDARAPMPLLVVHDGPHYAAYAELPRLLDALVAAGEPPFRAALVAAIDRTRDYTASREYADALVSDLAPTLEVLAPTPSGACTRAGLGASLGALALLHAHRLRPGTFGGLVLQSGSYFRLPDLFPAVERFVRDLAASGPAEDPIVVEMTCGTAERNLADNRNMRDVLAAQGYTVRLHEHRDAHNWTSWRDSLARPLRSLVRALWSDL